MAMWDPPHTAESAAAGEQPYVMSSEPQVCDLDDFVTKDAGFNLLFPDPAAPPATLRGAQAAEPSPRQDRPGAAGAASGPSGAPPLIHPQKWTEEMVRVWWERRTRRRKDIGIPSKGTDGRNIMRWPIARFEQLCNGNAGIAVALYQDLRNEIERYEQWKRSTLENEEGRPLPSPPPPAAVPSPGLSSPRSGTESSRRARVPDSHVTTRPKAAAARPPGSPNDFMSSESRRTGDLLQEPAKPSEPPRRPALSLQEKYAAAQQNPVTGIGGAGRRVATGGSLNVPLGGSSSGSDARRGNGSPSPGIAVAPCQRAAAAKASFKYAPAPRKEEQPQPAAQRRAAEEAAKDPAVVQKEGLRARMEAAKLEAAAATKLEAAAAGRKARVKSAPRPTRMPATPQAGIIPVASGVAPERGTTAPPRQRAATDFSPKSRPTPKAASASTDALPKSGPAPKAATKAPTKKPSLRAQVMEDLKDETLAQVGTPKKANEGSLFSRDSPTVERAGSEDSPHADRGAPRSRAETSQHHGHRAADDSDIARHRKGDGAEDDEACTRKMFDKRLLRRMNKDEFFQTLSSWRAQHLQEPSQASSKSVDVNSRVRVCVRKRPIFDNEVQAGEFDVISVRDSEVVVHNCLTKADLKSLFVSHMAFPFAHAFSENTTDDEVYRQCASPAVEHALRAGVATIFMFGQTGSGKTHTMEGIINRTIDHIFEDVSLRGADNAPTISLTAFEIAGKNIRDLLDNSGTPKEVKVMEDKSHRTRVLGVDSLEVQSPSELLGILQRAAAVRTTRSTQVNDTSSRSHAVYRIWLGSAGAVLTLVDCAGSERREDSSNHDAQSRKDAAEINSTIFALKECFRVMRNSNGKQPPYRDSLLTRVLSDSFASEQALIMAIGTVSPSASDTEHSIGTLRSLQQLQGTQMSHEARQDVVKLQVVEKIKEPRNWSEDDVRLWVERALNGRAQSHAAGIKKGTDGKNLVRWPMNRFTQLCAGDEHLGAGLYQDLRERIRSAGA